MLSHDFPLDHDITGGGERKAKKQTGSQPNTGGSCYVSKSVNDIVAKESKGEWGCFKVGLASGGEGENFHILGDQRTPNSGDYTQIRNMPVVNCGKSEARLHAKLAERGWRTLHGMDFNVPERWKWIFERQLCGTEFVCAPRIEFLDMMDSWYENYSGKKKRAWTQGWTGQVINSGIETAPPIIFQFNHLGIPTAANLRGVGRRGRPTEREALEFAWDYRILTGFAPEGCCSLTVPRPF